MMGGELCINATLAFARHLGKAAGTLYTSGLRDTVHYFNEGSLSSISFGCKFELQENRILFDGIGYALYPKNAIYKIQKGAIAALAEEYHLPAFGGIIFDENRIIPHIYVKGSDSFVQESACGSGSLAYAIYSGHKEIVQPSGGKILVSIGQEQVTVSAEVEPMTRSNTTKQRNNSAGNNGS
jgi:hypothetical protein